MIRWIPRPRMPVDIMTKSDVARGNEALGEMLRTGRWRLLHEATEIRERREGKAKPGRSRAASRKELAQDSGVV